MRWGNGGQRGREKSAVNSAIFLAAAVVLFSLIIARENVLSASMLSQSSEEQVGSDERISFWIACCILSQPIMCATASKRVVARVGLELFPFSSTYALTYKLKGPRRIETKTLISHVWGSWLEHRMSNKWYNKKVRELSLCWGSWIIHPRHRTHNTNLLLNQRIVPSFFRQLFCCWWMAKGTSTICDSYHETQTDMNNFLSLYAEVEPRVNCC